MKRLSGRMEGMENRLVRVEKFVVVPENRVDELGTKASDIAADLTGHRRDTRAHRKGWRVRKYEKKLAVRGQRKPVTKDR